MNNKISIMYESYNKRQDHEFTSGGFMKQKLMESIGHLRSPISIDMTQVKDVDLGMVNVMAKVYRKSKQKQQNISFKVQKNSTLEELLAVTKMQSIASFN